MKAPDHVFVVLVDFGGPACTASYSNGGCGGAPNGGVAMHGGSDGAVGGATNDAVDGVVPVHAAVDSGDGAIGRPAANGSTPAGCSGALRFYFGREVAVGQRDLVSRYDLKRRNYIGAHRCYCQYPCVLFLPTAKVVRTTQTAWSSTWS